MLIKRKLTKKETIQEYYYTMKELAARGKVKPESLIQYVIDGIADDVQGKLILYGTKKLSEFKEKLKAYETMREKYIEGGKTIRGKEGAVRRTNDVRGAATTKRNEREQEAEVRCYNCGAKGHYSRDCKKREIG